MDGVLSCRSLLTEPMDLKVLWWCRGVRTDEHPIELVEGVEGVEG